jgi:PAS domain S-box-containing protein
VSKPSPEPAAKRQNGINQNLHQETSRTALDQAPSGAYYCAIGSWKSGTTRQPIPCRVDKDFSWALRGIDPLTWSYSYNPDIWPAIVTLALMAYLGHYSWRRRHLPGAGLFALACAVCAPWILGVIMEISAVAIPTKVFWYQFQAVWPMAAAAMITCFILRFAGLDSWLNVRTYALLFLVPVLNALTIATNPLHHLMWASFEISGHIVPSPGRLFWWFNSFVYLLGVMNLAVLIWIAVRSPGHRRSVAIILCGQVLGRVGYALDKMDTGWFGPGESAFFTVGIVAVSYVIAFSGFHMIDPVTTARASVLEQMREGMFVLDRNNRILDVNLMGASILGTDRVRLLGRLASDVLPLDAGVPEGLGDTDPYRSEVVLGDSDSPRVYDVNRTPLRDRNGDSIGQLLLLHDTTEHRQAQARILQQQEVVATLRERERLARELHDGIGQTLGYVGMQAQAALQWVHRGKVELAETTLGRLVDVAHGAHADVRESIFGLKADSLQGWSFVPTLRTYLEKYQRNYGIRTTLEISDGVADDAFEPAAGVQLLRVVQEAMSNSRRHGDASNLKVSISMSESQAHVTITDDGAGFDSARLGELDGSHFGLAFMRQRIQQIGGSMKIDSKPGAGTALMLDVPTQSHWRKDVESSAG